MKTIRFVSLGCPKNLIDSEVMLGSLEKAGYKIVPDDKPADIFIVNTCCFIKEATQETEDIIEQAIGLKKEGIYKKIIVAGCLAQRWGNKVKSSYKGKIDKWLGVFDRDKLIKVCKHLEKVDNLKIAPVPKYSRIDKNRLRITPRHYAYLRIAEGCNNRCSYCVIPSFHGPYRSKPIQEIIKEAKRLVKDGVKEINIIAQDTTYYGKDLYGKFKLPEVLRKLSKIKGLRWIRLLYTHPRYFTDELVDEIARNSKVVKYIDIPVQHISDKILKKMARGVKKKDILELINKLRKRIKGLFLRTAVINGFPGETESHFDELVWFVKEVKFERLGAFKYSQEAETKARTLGNQVKEEVKNKRLDIIMRIQQQIAFKANKSLKGKTVSVIIDSKDDQTFIGRIYGDAPEVDGNIFVKGKNINVGQIYKVKISGFKGYDLIGNKA